MIYRGVVENNVDPKQLGRVQVRIFGIHSTDNSVSTKDLPWAEVSGGTDFGLYQGVGITSILRIGTLVWVFFHNNDYNYPVVFGVIKGSGDINDVAKQSYTNIATLKTESGHIIELNDTPSQEKIEIKHRTGSKIIIQPDGSILVESVNNTTIKTANEDKNEVGSNSTETIGGNKKITASNIYLN